MVIGNAMVTKHSAATKDSGYSNLAALLPKNAPYPAASPTAPKFDFSFH
jgi:hypothetical protein